MIATLVCLVVAALNTFCRCQPKGTDATPLQINLPPLIEPLTWTGRLLHSNGNVNGASATGTWNPSGTNHLFSGTLGFQEGTGWSKEVSGSLEFRNDISIKFNAEHNNKNGFSGGVSVNIPLGRN